MYRPVAPALVGPCTQCTGPCTWFCEAPREGARDSKFDQFGLQGFDQFDLRGFDHFDPHGFYQFGVQGFDQFGLRGAPLDRREVWPQDGLSEGTFASRNV